jgi:putative thioredoxin
MTTQAHQHTQNQAVIEVNEQNFDHEVVARSRQVPVVIDFWAPWCGPCRTLGPTLEKLAREANGAWVLAKVNVDENPRLSQAFRVQGIPAVKAVRDGKLVDEFTGALPETQVRAWLKRLAPDETEQLIEAAGSMAASDPEGAAARYRLVLGSDPTNVTALFELGRLLLLQGDAEGAAVLREVPEGTPFYPRAQALLGLAAFFAEATDADSTTLNEQILGQPADMAARYRLAALAARQGRYATAMEQLLTIVQRDRSFHDDGARKTLLALFEALGSGEPLVAEYRRKLASTLF